MPSVRSAVALLALISLGATSPPLRNIEREPESAAWTLCFDPSADIEELPGTDVRLFRVSLSPQRSAVTWRFGDEVFIYEIGGADHATRALALVNVLEQRGIESYVVARNKTRRDLLEVRQVLALQVRVVRR
jgi:hypothetical protein